MFEYAKLQNVRKVSKIPVGKLISENYCKTFVRQLKVWEATKKNYISKSIVWKCQPATLRNATRKLE